LLFSMSTTHEVAAELDLPFSKKAVEFLKQYIMNGGKERKEGAKEGGECFALLLFEDLVELAALAGHIRYPELFQEASTELSKRISVLAIADTKDLQRYLEALELLNINPHWQLFLKIGLIHRFYCPQKMPIATSEVDKTGFVVDISLLGLLRANDCVADVLRQTVRGFRLEAKGDEQYLEATEFM